MKTIDGHNLKTYRGFTVSKYSEPIYHYEDAGTHVCFIVQIGYLSIKVGNLSYDTVSRKIKLSYRQKGYPMADIFTKNGGNWVEIYGSINRTTDTTLNKHFEEDKERFFEVVNKVNQYLQNKPYLRCNAKTQILSLIDTLEATF